MRLFQLIADMPAVVVALRADVGAAPAIAARCAGRAWFKKQTAFSASFWQNLALHATLASQTRSYFGQVGAKPVYQTAGFASI